MAASDHRVPGGSTSNRRHGAAASAVAPTATTPTAADGGGEGSRHRRHANLISLVVVLAVYLLTTERLNMSLGEFALTSALPLHQLIIRSTSWTSRHAASRRRRNLPPYQELKDRLVDWEPDESCMYVFESPDLDACTHCLQARGSHSVNHASSYLKVLGHTIETSAAPKRTSSSSSSSSRKQPQGDIPAVITLDVEAPRSPACTAIMEGMLVSTASSSVADNYTLTAAANVVAFGNGTYRLSAVAAEPGEYSFRVRLLWEDFYPSTHCRFPCAKRLDDDMASPPSIAVPITVTTITAPTTTTTGILHGGVLSSSSSSSSPSSPPSSPQHKRRRRRPRCKTFEDLMNGAWVSDPRALPSYERVSDLPPYSSWKAGAWLPYDCDLRLYRFDEIQRAFEGKTIVFAGDSTMFKIMDSFVRLFGPPYSDHAPLAHEAKTTNDKQQQQDQSHRAYDSQNRFAARFVFDWLGGAQTTGVGGGIWEVLGQPHRFMSQVPDDAASKADFVLINAGAHEIASQKYHDVQSLPTDAYDKALPNLFLLLRGLFPSVHTDRFVWTATTPNAATALAAAASEPEQQPHGGGSAVRRWMNFLAMGHARENRIQVMDSHRLYTAAAAAAAAADSPASEAAAASRKEEEDTSANVLAMQAAVLVHYMMEQLVQMEEEEGAALALVVPSLPPLDQQQQPPQPQDEEQVGGEESEMASSVPAKVKVRSSDDEANDDMEEEEQQLQQQQQEEEPQQEQQQQQREEQHQKEPQQQEEEQEEEQQKIQRMEEATDESSSVAQPEKGEEEAGS